MVAKFDQYIRWDFLGLSTDTKPTPTTSEDVTDGSTYYEVDTSKLYVWCQDNWYEKQGGGGGGDTKQFIEITDDSVNYPKNNPSRVSLVDMDDGIYYVNTSKAVDIGQVDATDYRVSRGDWAVLTTRNASTKNYQVFHYDQTYSGTVSRVNGNVTNVYKKPKQVVDNLTSTDATDALSAKQGKILNESINAVKCHMTYNMNDGSVSTQQTAAQIESVLQAGKALVPYTYVGDDMYMQGFIVTIVFNSENSVLILAIYDDSLNTFRAITMTAPTKNDVFTGSVNS